MSVRTLSSILPVLLATLVLSACSTPSPYVQAWNEPLATNLSGVKNNVQICFNRRDSAREEIFQLARKACVQQARLRQNFLEQEIFADVQSTLQQADGTLFGGPSARAARLQMVESQTQAIYTGENDRWYCSWRHPDRASFDCVFPDIDPRSTPAPRSGAPAQAPAPVPELPPDLPEDLRIAP